VQKVQVKTSEITDDQIEALYRRIGNNVKRIRTQKGISQLALALAIGHKSVGTVSMAEIGLNNKHFNIKHLTKIADVLEVDICVLFA
jgi:transcriptional regulator with XRE-family HTH domain